jgi:hypothetical protein
MYEEAQTKGAERAEGKFQVLGRVAGAALVTVVLSSTLFFSYIFIGKLQRSPQLAAQAAATSTSTAVATDETLRNKPVWALGDTSLLSAPGTGQALAHVGQHFPLTLLGGISLVRGERWYQVQWKAPRTAGEGWAPAKALTFASPGNVPGWASFDVLSADLAGYLAALGNTAAAVVYDVTRQRYYTYNMNGRFVTGSSVKVPIMLAFLHQVEREHRRPTKDEICLLTAMIERSDNDAASAFYYGYLYAPCGAHFEAIGGARGLSNYLKQIGITGLNPDPHAYGYSTVSPLTMVNLLTLLHAGKILTQADRDLALNLMEHVTRTDPLDEQVGVGDTAPEGATVAMKDGWVEEEGPDGPETGPWAMNSSGIVTLGQETYIISVYTGEQASLQAGKDIATRVCKSVASALL